MASTERLSLRMLMRVLGYGVAAWFVVFAVSMGLYPWRVDNRTLFEAVIPVVMVATYVAVMTLYLAGASGAFVLRGLVCGAFWAFEALFFDWIAFSVGPMQLDFSRYVQDIGVTYLMIPVITVGLAWQRARGHGASMSDAGAMSRRASAASKPSSAVRPRQSNGPL